MTQHTPGPWEYVGHGHDRTVEQGYFLRIAVKNDTNRTIAYAQGYQVADVDRYKDERRANARLIAAAPELLSVLRELYADWLTCHANGIADDKQVLRSAAHLALIKATGEA